MPLEDLCTLIDYHYWARDRVLAAAAALSAEQFTRDMSNSFRSVRDTLVHIYSAEWAWHQRWIGHSPTTHIAAEDYPDVAVLAAAWRAHEETLRRFVNGLGDDGVDRLCEYRTLNGQPGTSSFAEMIRHVVNHASYHRGQVTTMLRQLGAAPAQSLDLIGFYRERRGRTRYLNKSLTAGPGRRSVKGVV
jgi:uncharacterized damage-inducible protein DinB